MDIYQARTRGRVVFIPKQLKNVVIYSSVLALIKRVADEFSYGRLMDIISLKITSS